MLNISEEITKCHKEISKSRILKKYLFIYLAASGLSCGMRDLLLCHAGSSLGHVGFSLVAACRLSSCGARA